MSTHFSAVPCPTFCEANATKGFDRRSWGQRHFELDLGELPGGFANLAEEGQSARVGGRQRSEWKRGWRIEDGGWRKSGNGFDHRSAPASPKCLIIWTRGKAIVTPSAPKKRGAHKSRQLHASRETSASVGAFRFHFIPSRFVYILGHESEIQHVVNRIEYAPVFANQVVQRGSNSCE